MRRLFLSLFLMMCLFGVLIMPMVMVGCSGDDDDDNDDSSMGSLFPIKAGTAWNYQVTPLSAAKPGIQATDPYSVLVEGVGYTVVNGVQLFETESTYADFQDWTEFLCFLFFGVENNNALLPIQQIKKTFEYRGDTSTIEEEYQFQPAPLIWPSLEELAVKSAWSSTGTLTSKMTVNGQQTEESQSTYSFELALLGRENVTAAAGTFQNCYKFSSHRTLTNEYDNTYYNKVETLFVAEGVGLVLKTSEHERWELSSYSGL